MEMIWYDSEKLPNLENRRNLNHFRENSFSIEFIGRLELSAVKEQKEETTLWLEWLLALSSLSSLPSSFSPVFLVSKSPNS